MTPTEVRLALHRNGYHPLPVNGKAPTMDEWTDKLATNDDEIRLWNSMWHYAGNTGVIAKFTPGLDIDILDLDAAEAIETLARGHFEEHGVILVRIGRPPKRLIPLRTDEPFKKLVRNFVAPNGKQHKIEVLGDGQQWVSHGIYPDTGEPYGWHGGGPETTAQKELPYVRREDVTNFLDEAVQLLAEQFNYVLKKGAATDDGGPHEAGEPQASAERIAAALAVIPNNEDWDGWNNIGMAMWRATGGSEVGLAAFDAWSKKSPKHDADTTAARWAHYFNSPPSHIGAGTIFHLANQASPNWWLDYQAQVNPPPPEPGPEPPPTEGSINEGSAHDFTWTLRSPGEENTDVVRRWLSEGVLPQTGIGLIAGQWGTFKTFCAFDLSAAVMCGGQFISFPIARPGGVLLLATEGQNEVNLRLSAAWTAHGGRGRPPFIWVNKSPRLLDKYAADILIAMINHAKAKLAREHDGIGLSLVLIDALGKAAGYTKAGDENDAAIAKRINKALNDAALATDTFILGVTHFGKTIETGTRGSSAFEDDTDVVLALIGDRATGGQVSNTRLCVRKNCAGQSGAEFPFQTRSAAVGDESTLVIDWHVAAQVAPKQGADGWKKKSLRLLRQTLMNMLVDCGRDIRPWADGPIVRGVDLELVRGQFYKGYPAAEAVDEKSKANARRQAFGRAVNDAKASNLIGSWMIEGVTYVWLLGPTPAQGEMGLL